MKWRCEWCEKPHETTVSEQLNPQASAVGVDIHIAPDDDIYVTVVSC